MRLRLLWITWSNNRVLFLMPIIVLYLILPALTITTAVNQSIEKSWMMFIFILQTLAPISACFWLIAYLNIWLDEDGEECIRCSQINKPTAVGEVILMLSLFTLLALPIFATASFYYDMVFIEFLRFTISATFLISMLYFFSTLIRSLTISTMLVLSYAVFSITYSRDGALQQFCLLKPYVAVSMDKVFTVYLPLLIISSLLIIMGRIIERKFHFYRK